MAVSSIHFGTENLIFVPEDRGLSLFDLYHWCRFALPVHDARLRLRPAAAPRVRDEIRKLVSEYLKTADGRARREEIQGFADGFLRSLLASAQAPEPALAPARWMDRHTAPDRLTFWVRVGDAPAESYFEEDYDYEQEGKANAGFGLPLYGSISLSTVGDGEVLLPEGGPDSAFLLALPSESSFRVSPIDPLAPLPIIHEFCGSGGASNQGNTANYTLQSRLSRIKLGCVPLHRIGSGGFATLYLHLETALSHDVLVRIRGRRLALARKKIVSLGYTLAREGQMYEIWERRDGGDVLHVYADLPGRESEMIPTLSPFVLAARAGNGFDPAERSKLVGELVTPGQPGDS